MRRHGADIMWLVVLLALASVIGTLLAGGEILLYLAPRMVTIVWLGFAVLVVLVVYQAAAIIRSREEKETKKKIMNLSSLIFLIPVILMLTVTPDSSASAAIPGKTIQMPAISSEDTSSADEQDKVNAFDEHEELQTSASDKTPAEQSTPKPEQTPAQSNEQDQVAGEAESMTSLLPCILQQGKEEFEPEEDQFSEYIYMTGDELEGHTVKLYGYVYKDDTFPKDTIMAARLYLYCCAADAYLVGFHIKVENEDD